MPDGYTKAEWERVLQWRPLVYKLLAEWATKKTRRKWPITMRGRIGQPRLELSPAGDGFEWITYGAIFGVDGRSFMEDFEAPALHAAVVASRSFDPSRGLTFEAFLRPILFHDLEDEFRKWIRTSESMASGPIDEALELEAAPFVEADAEDGLDPDVRDALQEAMGALTAKEAWALRMYADGVPVRVIQERLGHARDTSTHALIKRAKEKALRVMQDQLPEAEVQ